MLEHYRTQIGTRLEAVATMDETQEPFEGQYLDGTLEAVVDHEDYLTLSIRSSATGRLWLVDVQPDDLNPVLAYLADGEPETPEADEDEVAESDEERNQRERRIWNFDWKRGKQRSVVDAGDTCRFIALQATTLFDREYAPYEEISLVALHDIDLEEIGWQGGPWQGGAGFGITSRAIEEHFQPQH